MRTFAALSYRRAVMLSILVGIFYAQTLYGALTPCIDCNGQYRRPTDDLAAGSGAPFFIAPHKNNLISSMLSRNEIASRAKNSSAASTPDCESVSNQLNLLPKSEQNLNHVDGDGNVTIGGNGSESEINSQSVGETQGEGILGNNVESSNIQNGTNLSSQTNHVDKNTGITGISGTGHTINNYNYACPPEIIELILKLNN
jgi:hypothetical protein